MNRITILLILTLSLFITSCNSVRESAGVNRKNIDEYQIVENPPLIIPPDFNLLPPDQIESKKIDISNSEIAEQILFGLDNSEEKNVNENNLLQDIIQQTNSNNIDNSIRNDINSNFAGEKLIDEEVEFKSIDELNNAIKKSELERNNLLGKKKQKKKKFIFF